jgi:hypothetical protein
MRNATATSAGEEKLRNNKTTKAAIIAGVFAALFVLAIHFLFHVITVINDIPRGLSWNVRGPFIDLYTLTKTGKLGHLIDILGFPRTEFGFIPNSIFHGLLFGFGYYMWRRRKNRLLRWSLFKPPSQQKSAHSTEKEKDNSMFCRLRITTCCQMPLLRNAKHRIYYYDPQDPNKAIQGSQLLHVRCPWCGAKIWHARAWSATATLPNSWVCSLQKYKGNVRQLPSKIVCDEEEE